MDIVATDTHYDETLNIITTVTLDNLFYGKVESIPFVKITAEDLFKAIFRFPTRIFMVVRNASVRTVFFQPLIKTHKNTNFTKIV